MEEGAFDGLTGAMPQRCSYIETYREALVAAMVAESGQPVFFAEGTQFRSGLALGRDTIDLYLSMRHAADAASA